MNRVTCSNCGAEATVSRGSYHFIESGLDDVVLQGIEIIHCDNCENDDPIIPRMNDLMRLLTIAVIGKRYTLCGEEIRFLRKYLLKTAEQLAQMLHVDKTTVSKWENNADKIGDQSDRLLRVYALALGDGLETKLKDMIECFPAIEREQRHIGIEIDPSDMSHRYV